MPITRALAGVQTDPDDGIPRGRITAAEWILLSSLALNILEGAIRKWIPDWDVGVRQYLAYFSKDIVFASLILLVPSGTASRPMMIFRHWLVPGCALIIIGAVLSSVYGFNPVGAVLTLRATIVLPVLAWLAAQRLAGLSIRNVAWMLAVFTVLNFALAVIQNRFPSDHILNRYLISDMWIAAIGSGVRATGTFSYITGLSVMSGVGIWSGMVLLSMARSQLERGAGWIAIASGLGCALASGARSAILIGGGMLLAWVLFSRSSISVAARSLIAAFSLGTLVALSGLFPLYSDMASALLERNESAGDEFTERAFGQLREGVLAIQESPFGNGLGSEQVGGKYYSTGTVGFTTFEGPLPRLVMEVGGLGVAGFLVISVGAIVALQIAKRNATPGGKAALFATQLFLPPLFYTNVAFNHTASAFCWMIFASVMAATVLVPDRLRS
jgi:hypothetical protein